MDLSIIIVNYNTLELTQTCIESVQNHTKAIDYEIILVDNASTDGSIEYFSSLEGILFVESGGNIGFGRANNLGYKYSSGRYLLMLNSDTILENDVLSRMVHHFDQQPDDVACLGSLLVHADRKPSCSFGYYVDWREEFGFNVTKGSTTIISGSQEVVEYVSGADLFVRRSVVEQYGLFDPDFFMYYEDMELGYRYRAHGLQSVIVNESGIVHLEGASSKNSCRKISIMTRSYLLYLHKTLPKRKYHFVKSCICLRRMLTVWHYRWPLRDSLNYIQMLIKS